MKKLTALLCALALLLPAAFARGVEQVDVRFYNEKTGLYGEVIPSSLVHVTFAGEEMELDVPAVIVNKRTLVPVAPIAVALGADVAWENETLQVTITGKEDTIRLRLGESTAEVNGQVMDLPSGVPATMAKFQGVERTLVPLLFVSERLHARVSWDGETFTASVDPPEETPAQPPEEPPREEPEEPAPVEQTLTGHIVTIDPGHGGVQPGAIYEGILEKELDLAISLEVKRLLEEKGCRVVMTREDDSHIELEDRCAVANEAGAEIFLSIHSNAYTDAAVKGTSTYFYPGSGVGQELAGYVQRAVVESAGSQDRGVLSGQYKVLHYTKMPAALIEVGFMTCPEELALLADPAYQLKLARGIAGGMEAYLLDQGK